MERIFLLKNIWVKACIYQEFYLPLLYERENDSFDCVLNGNGSPLSIEGVSYLC